MTNWKERIREKQKKDNRAVHNFLPDSPLSKNAEEKDELKVQENEAEKSNLNVDETKQEEVQEEVEEPFNRESNLAEKDQLQPDLKYNLNDIEPGAGQERSDFKENLNDVEQVIEQSKREVSATVQDYLIQNLNLTITQRNYQPSFEDQYKRKTFAIERDLLNRFNRHMSRFPKGEQTRVINEILRQYVDWLDAQRGKG